MTRLSEKISFSTSKEESTSSPPAFKPDNIQSKSSSRTISSVYKAYENTSPSISNKNSSSGSEIKMQCKANETKVIGRGNSYFSSFSL